MKTNLIRVSIMGLVLVAASCGGSEQADTITAQPTTTTAPASTVGDPAETTTTSTAEPTTTTEALAGVEDLERMSLQLADMPAGWAETVPEPDDSNDAFCVDDDDSLISSDGWPKVEKEFSAGAFGPFLTYSILAAPGDSEAKDLMKQFADLAEQCTSWSNDEGSYSLSPVNYPSVGDETFAIRLTVEADGFTVLGDAIVIREGNVLSLMLPAGLAAPVDAETVVGWMNLIDERD